MTTSTLPDGVALCAASTCNRCGRTVKHKPAGGPQARHFCRLRWLSRIRHRAHIDGWGDGYRIGCESTSPFVRLAYFDGRRDERALPPMPDRFYAQDATPLDVSPDLATRLTAAVVTTSKTITDSYPAHLCREAADRRRIDKLSEEVGEVTDAYGGWVGENPRKGRRNGVDKVLDELLDVAACALGAYEHLTGFQGDCVPALVDQTERKRERLLAAIKAADDA